MFMGYSKPKGDVLWTLPGKKKAVAYSIKATSDLIVMLSKEYDIVQQVHDVINYDEDAKAVLQKFIDAGYGAAILKNMVR